MLFLLAAWIAAALVLFAAGEVILRIGEPSLRMYNDRVMRQSDDPEMISELVPGGRGYLRGVFVEINSKGLRDREFAYAKPAGVRRIVGLGDSFTFGMGTETGRVFLKALERMLDRERPGRFQVLNMGVPGHNTASEFHYLKTEGVRYDPDVVIVCFTVNDAQQSSETYADHRFDSARSFVLEALRDIRNGSYLVTFLFSRWQYATLRLRSRYNDTDYHNALYAPGRPGWEACRRALGDLSAWCDRRGARCLLVLFPFMTDLDDRYPFAGIHAKVAAEARARGLPVLDLFESFRGRRATDLWVSLMDSHPNARAHDIAARAVFEHLEKSGVLDE